MRRNRQIPFSNKIKFAMVVDGECESWYFQMLKRNEKSLSVDLKPEIPQKKKLNDLFEKVIEQSNYYDKVFWIVDYDVINSETRLAKKGDKTAKEEFKEYCSKLEENHKNVIVIVNNPCLEFWILLHFEATGKYFDKCEGATKQLKKYLPDYEKTSKYFTRQDKDIYTKLKPNLKTAIANSKRLTVFDFENTNIAMTQMQLLFETEELKQIIESD